MFKVDYVIKSNVTVWMQTCTMIQVRNHSTQVDRLDSDYVNDENYKCICEYRPDSACDGTALNVFRFLLEVATPRSPLAASGSPFVSPEAGSDTFLADFASVVSSQSRVSQQSPTLSSISFFFDRNFCCAMAFCSRRISSFPLLILPTTALLDRMGKEWDGEGGSGYRRVGSGAEAVDDNEEECALDPLDGEGNGGKRRARRHNLTEGRSLSDSDEPDMSDADTSSPLSSSFVSVLGLSGTSIMKGVGF